jgi:hypothetical protein
MSWVFLWLLLGIVTTLVFLVFAISVARHAVIIGRTARRFQDEVAPLAGDVSREGSRAADRAQGLHLPAADRRS